MKNAKNIVTETISGFDSSAETKTVRSGHNRIHHEYCLRRIREILIDAVPLKDSAVVLDAGCGTGELSSDILQHTPWVISADISLSSLRKAKTLLSNKTNLVLSDLTSSCFKEGVFDVIISSEVLEHTPNPHLMLKHLVSLLESNGSLAVTTPNPMMVFFHISTIAWLLTRPRSAYRKLRREENMWSHPWGCDLWIHPWQLNTLLEEVGLQLEKRKSRHIIFLPDVRGLLYQVCKRLMSEEIFERFLRSLQILERSPASWAGSRYLRVARKA